MPELPSERKGIDDIAVIIFMLNLFGGYFLLLTAEWIGNRTICASLGDAVCAAGIDQLHLRSGVNIR
jgi:hypothetical protein